MGVLSTVAIAAIKVRGSIDDVDVLELRRKVDDGRITADEADIVFSLNHACPVQHPAWADWFVETLTDYVVDQAKPEGYLTSGKAIWLIARIAEDGRIASKTEMDLLLSVLDRARWVPISLVCFALVQVKHAIVGAVGPLRSGRPLAPCIVGEGDVDLLRRILCAFDGDLPVTRPEAGILLDIDAATRGSENHPSWRDLLMRAVASCVMAASGYATPPRTLALARDPWLVRRGPVGFERRAVGATSGVGGLIGSYRRRSDEERDIARLTRQKIEIVTHEPLAEAEAGWLASRLENDGTTSANVRALLVFLKGEGSALHPSLQALVDKVTVAA